MVIADPTLPSSVSAVFCNASRFPIRPASPGSGLPPESPLEANRGKIVSLRGSFPVAGRTTAFGAKAQCAEGYYSVADLLRDGACSHSRGVVNTESRFRWQSVVGGDSPGPIFYAENHDHVQGGVFSTMDRFPPKLHRANNLTLAREAMALQYAASSNAVIKINQRSHSTAPCNFGLRLQNQNSPFRRSATPIHTYARDGGSLETQRIFGGAISRAQRKLPSQAIAERDPTPGPGQFNITSTLGKQPFHIGRRVRPQLSTTPGPCSYDVGAVDERMRRARR